MEPVDAQQTTKTTEGAFTASEVPPSFSMTITNRLVRTKSALTEQPDNQNLKKYLEIYTGANESLISGTDSKDLRTAILFQKVILTTQLIETMNKNRDAAATGFEPTPPGETEKE